MRQFFTKNKKAGQNRIAENIINHWFYLLINWLRGHEATFTEQVQNGGNVRRNIESCVCNNQAPTNCELQKPFDS
jgi:hypothetical protein